MTKGSLFKGSLASLLLLLAAAAQAANDLRINGVAAYREFGETVYLGALFSQTPAESAAEALALDGPRRMEVRLLGTVSDRRWTNTWMQSIAINNRQETVLAAAQALSNTLSAFAGDLKPGDRVIIGYDPDNGTVLSVNGVELIQGQSKELFNLFLSAWVGPVPPSTDFKQGILGSSATGLVARFQTIEPGADRVAAVRQWVADKKQVADTGPEGLPKPPETPRTDNGRATPRTAATVGDSAGDNGDAKPRPSAPAAPTVAAKTSEKKPEAKPQKSKQGRTEPAAVEKASDAGLSVEAILAQQEYFSKVIRRIYKAVRYPRSAVRRNEQGSIRIDLTLSREGEIVEAALSDKSPHDSLNEEALRAVEAAAPYPAFPDKVDEKSLTVQVPVAFKLAQ